MNYHEKFVQHIIEMLGLSHNEGFMQAHCETVNDTFSDTEDELIDRVFCRISSELSLDVYIPQIHSTLYLDYLDNIADILLRIIKHDSRSIEMIKSGFEPKHLELLICTAYYVGYKELLTALTEIFIAAFDSRIIDSCNYVLLMEIFLRSGMYDELEKMYSKLANAYCPERIIDFCIDMDVDCLVEMAQKYMHISDSATIAKYIYSVIFSETSRSLNSHYICHNDLLLTKLIQLKQLDMTTSDVNMVLEIYNVMHGDYTNGVIAAAEALLNENAVFNINEIPIGHEYNYVKWLKERQIAISIDNPRYHRLNDAYMFPQPQKGKGFIQELLDGRRVICTDSISENEFIQELIDIGSPLLVPVLKAIGADREILNDVLDMCVKKKSIFLINEIRKA